MEGLRKKLFATSGLLIETNTGKTPWATGINFQDEFKLRLPKGEAYMQSRWKGGCYNFMGALVTMIRGELMKEFPQEASKSFQDRMLTTLSTHRPRSGSGTSMSGNTEMTQLKRL